MESSTRVAAWVTAGLFSFFLLHFSFVRAQQPTFRTGTTLVEMTVVALDSRGNPVTDLGPDELVLSEQGQRREIAFFRFEGGPAPADAAVAPLPALSPGFVSNRPEYQPEPQRNVTALLIDLINTAPPDQNGARAQLLRHLETLPEGSPVGVFQFSESAGLSMLAPFSRQAEGVRAGLESIVAVTRQSDSWRRVRQRQRPGAAPTRERASPRYGAKRHHAGGTVGVDGL
jgi:VWFA-related protein